jgi:hypothetical protein
MKLTLTGFIVLSVFSITAFGFLAMGHGTGSGHGGFCLGPVAQSVPCPEKDPLGFASFHLNAFQNLLQAVFGNDAMGVLLIWLALAFASSVFFSAPFFSPNFDARLQYIHVIERASFPLVRKLNRWLAFHENSPSLA